MILGVHHVGITVPDLSRALEYQRTGLGLEPDLLFDIEDSDRNRKVMGIGNTAAKVALIRCPNAFLELTQFTEDSRSQLRPRAINEQGIVHYCVQGPEIAPLHKRFGEAGSRFYSDPLDLGTGNDYCYLEDTQNTIIELEGLPWAPTVCEFWLGHVALVTTDIALLADFYSEVFNSGEQPIASFGNNLAMDRMSGLKDVALKGCWIPTSNMLLELWQFEQPATRSRAGIDPVSRPGISHIALEVTDLGDEVERLTVLGMTMFAEPIVGDAASLVYGYDPDGNIIELIELADPASTRSIRQLDHPNMIAELAAAKNNAAA